MARPEPATTRGGGIAIRVGVQSSAGALKSSLGGSWKASSLIFVSEPVAPLPRSPTPYTS